MLRTFRRQTTGSQSATRPSTTAVSRRRGFTLVEVMIVVVIITILAGLLIPAISSVRRKVVEGQVRTEISALEKAITEFRTTYNIDPPSSIELSEVGGIGGSGWNTRSAALIRQMWPQFNFGIARDFNGNGTTGEMDPDGDGSPGLTLTGSQCLVFFLGGMRDTGSTGALVGFSKNPANPFALGGNREGPFFEFAIGRLYVSEDLNRNGVLDSGEDVNSNSVLDTAIQYQDVFGSGLAPVFVDTLPNQTAPYLYGSSYKGQGYSTTELVVAAGGSPPVIPGFLMDFYRQGAPTGPYFHANGFQIISPGLDNTYGKGGAFDPEGKKVKLDEEEADNITNFHSGRLGN